MKKIEEVTCLKFIAYNEKVHNDWVTVQGTDSGCYSYVGRVGWGEQLLNLEPNKLEDGCFKLYTIIHEFIHGESKNFRISLNLKQMDFFNFQSCRFSPHAIRNKP
jgi:Astacin (Peptidase family M12A)